MDREYAQPLDVEALARGVHMSAGHLSREFKKAYGESPYQYLMTRRIERAMTLLRRGDLSVTDVCFEVGCSSLGHVQHPVHRAGRGVAQRLPRARPGATLAGVPSCETKKVTADRSGIEKRPPAEPRLAWAAWTSAFTPPSSRTTTRTPRSRSTATRSASSCATTSATTACTGSPSVRPDQPDVNVVLYPPARRPGRHRGRAAHHHRDDGQGHLRQHHAQHTGPRQHLRAAPGQDVEIVQEPIEQDWGMRDCAVRDPTGNMVRIQEVR